MKQHETRDTKEPNMGTPSPPPMTKTVLFCGRSAVLACDGRCDKAWGINKRPQLYFQESLLVPRALAPGERPRDPDDTVYLGDAELGTAPEDPGTYEGGHGKPSAVPLTDPSRMNKWCARECERSAILEPGEALVSPNLARPRPNIPGRPYPTEHGGAEPEETEPAT
jgi:hypothetical protein